MIAANVVVEALQDLWGPGLVFLVLCGWLVRRALRAARNESILEEQRLRAGLGDFATADPRTNAANAATNPRVHLQPALPAEESTNVTASRGPPADEETAPADESSNVTALRSPPSDEATPPAVHLPQALTGADVRGASQEHVDAVARLISDRDAAAAGRRCEVLWIRSTATHVAWAERRRAQRELICVAQIDSGKIVARWQFG